MGGLLANSAGKLLPSSPKFVAPRQPAGHDPALPLSMMAVAAHAGFLAVALQGCAKQCGQLRASRQLFREVAGAVKRGDLQGAVRRLKEAGGRWWGRAARRGGASLPACLLSAPPSACPPPCPTPAADLSVTARVIESGALQAHRNADRFSIELCAEAAALCGALLASSAAVQPAGGAAAAREHSVTLGRVCVVSAEPLATHHQGRFGSGRPADAQPGTAGRSAGAGTPTGEAGGALAGRRPRAAGAGQRAGAVTRTLGWMAAFTALDSRTSRQCRQHGEMAVWSPIVQRPGRRNCGAAAAQPPCTLAPPQVC